MRTSNSARIAALPMYDFAELAAFHDDLWTGVAVRLIAAHVAGVPTRLSRELNYVATWQDPRLLLGQACEFPLAKASAGHVRVVATPLYSAPGCEGARYRSAIVVRSDSPAVGVADLRDSRCVINAIDSNSGVNLLRAAIAPLARHGSLLRDGRFFRSVTVSGAHRCSAEMIVRGEADVAALDCVTFAHLQRLDPGTMSGLRVLGWTPASPSLPFVTASSTSDVTLAALRDALVRTLSDPDLVDVRARLYLIGVEVDPDPSFAEVLRLEQEAVERGYPTLV